MVKFYPNRLPIYCTLAFLTPFTAFAQGSQPKALTHQQALNAKKLKEIKALLAERTCDKKANLVTNYFFTDTVAKIQNTISGSSIKDGKLAATSASIDEKSITVNVGFAMIPEFIDGQINLSGRSEDGFLKVFEGGQYQKTIGVGGTFNIFTKNAKAKFYCRSWNLQHNQLNAYSKRMPLTGDKAAALQKNYSEKLIQFAAAHALLKQMQSRLVDLDARSEKEMAALADYDALRKELAPVLPANFDNLTAEAADAVLKRLTAKENADKMAKLLYETAWLQGIDSIQSLAKWNSFSLNWITLKGGWEQQKYEYLNASFASGTDVYTDNYFTGSIAWNWLWSDKKRRFNLWVSPTVKVDTKRDFSGNAMHLVQGAPYVLGADTFTHITKDWQLYNAIPDGRTSFTIELPVSVYFPKAYCGLDVAVHTGLTEGTDKLGGRIGIYVPVQVSEGNAVVIEPLMRFKNLTQTGGDFWKDRVAFGFNLSVTIPEFMKQ